jgi:mannose-6-phosphate isomerase-like protein (cupin superfamily)
MAFERIALPLQAWVQGGHPLERKKTAPAHGLTLLEFAPGFADPNWCVNGHFMFVLAGTFAVELDSGVETLEPGEACVVDSGTRHRARNAGTSAVQLLVIAR